MLIAYLDDASRFVVGYGVFDDATTENAISVLERSINRYGKPLELLTDHGSQFYANFGEIKAFGISKFQQYLVYRKINHSWTFQSKGEHFSSIEEFVTWYNTSNGCVSRIELRSMIII
jgi:putative transposase